MANSKMAPEYQPYQDIYKSLGTDWNSKNAVQYAARAMLGSQLPFLLGLQPLQQQLIYGQLGAGLDQQDALRNAYAWQAQQMQNQDLAQGNYAPSADYGTMAGLGANAALRDQIAGTPQRQLGAISGAYQMAVPWANLASQGFAQTPKGPGFLGQVLNTVASVYGAGGNPFGSSGGQSVTPQMGAGSDTSGGGFGQTQVGMNPFGGANGSGNLGVRNWGKALGNTQWGF